MSKRQEQIKFLETASPLEIIQYWEKTLGADQAEKQFFDFYRGLRPDFLHLDPDNRI